MKERSIKEVKSNHRVNPVSGKEVGAMTVEEQQMAEIIGQSKKEVAESNTIVSFRDALNTLMKSFNLDKMNLQEAARIYEACKDHSSEEEDGDVDSDGPSTSAKTGPKRRRTRESTGALSQMLPTITEDENGAGPPRREDADKEMDTLDANMTERERAIRMRKEMFRATAREELRARTSIPTVVRKPPMKNGTGVNTQGDKAAQPADNDGYVQQSTRTLKGRIRVHNLQADKVLKILEEKNIPVNLKMSKDGSTMVACEAEQRLDVVKVMKESGQWGHSYMTKEDRYEVRMLKGINFSFGPNRIKEEILEKLKERDITAEDVHVDRFKTYHSIVNGKQYHMYVVKVENADIMNATTSIGLCNSVCTRDTMRKSDVTQCFNCYEFGHSQKGGCFKPRRCKKCLVVEENHVCSVEQVEATEENGWNIYAKYQCCNCKKFGHPPTYSKCKKRKDAVGNAKAAKEARNRRRWEKKNPNQQYVSAPVPTTNAWANNNNGVQWQQQHQTQQPQQPQQVGGLDLEEEIRKVLGIVTSKLQALATNSIASYKTKQTREEKAKALGLYFLGINGFTP